MLVDLGFESLLSCFKMYHDRGSKSRILAQISDLQLDSLILAKIANFVT